MSKRTKKLRSNHSGFKLETLEQRQLLATIVAGSGTEVNTDVVLSNGTFDQIMLTGTTVTVGSDWDATTGTYQVTRVDFLDTDGDIVRVEFAGAGTLRVDLTDFAAAAPADNYTDFATQKYVQGVATFTIEGSDETTNVSIYSLGSVNAQAQLFDEDHQGGNNVANVSLLLIESDGGVLGNAFGGIFAGNAVFGGDESLVGLAAEKIQFFGPINIGGIEATDDAVAYLKIGQFSANSTVTLAGTNLAGNNDIDIEGVEGLVLASGTTSMGEVLDTQTYDPDVFSVADAADIEAVTYTSNAETVVLDENTTLDDIEALETRYLNDIVIEASFADSEEYDAIVAAGITALMFGDVTVNGDLSFAITTTTEDIGDVVINGTIVDGGVIVSTLGSIGNVTVTGDIDFSEDNYTTAGAALIWANGDVGDVTFADVTIDDDTVSLVVANTGNIGKVSAGAVSFTDANAVLNAGGDIGDIEFAGDVELTGVITADGDIGNISADKLTTAAITAGGSVGTITTGDDADLALVTANGGGIGAIMVAGDLTVAGLDAKDGSIGAITADGDILINGAVTADDATADENADIGAITAGGALTIGEVTADGDIGALKATEGTLVIGGIITAGGDIGAITTVDGSLSVTEAVTAGGSIGAISVAGEGMSIDFGLGGSFSAAESIGDVTVAEGAITSLNITEAEFTANVIGNVSVTGGEATAVLLSDVVFRALGEDAVIGDVTLDSSANTAGAVAASAAASTTEVSGTGFSSTGDIGDITITAHEDGKLLVDAGDVLLFRAGNSHMGDNFDDVAYSGTVSIGDVTIEADLAAGLGGNTPGTGLIIVSGIEASADGVFVSGLGGLNGTVTVPSKEVTIDDEGEAITLNGTIGNITLTDLGGATVGGFVGNSLAADTAFTGGSVIAANSRGILTVNAGTEVSRSASGTANVGALDIDEDTEFTTSADLFVIVV